MELIPRIKLTFLWLFDVQVSFLKQAISIYRLAIKLVEMYYTSPNTLIQEDYWSNPPSSLKSQHAS